MERKVGLGGVGASIGVLVTWLTGDVNWDIVTWTPEAAGALSVILAMVTGYFVPNPK